MFKSINNVFIFRIGYVEIPEEYSMDIDTKIDLLIAEQIDKHIANLSDKQGTPDANWFG